jgi:DMSO/TMAO reductase YedYZ molybdopterin-dependent catalytic subunit
MESQDLSRRTLLKDGGAALAELTVLRVAGLAQAFGRPGDEVIPWLDQPAANPIPDNVGNLLQWEALDSWLTPTNNFFFVNHYGQPDGLDESTWRVGIAGLVARPQSLTLADLKARQRREVDSHWSARATPAWTSSSAASAMPAGRERSWPRC